MLVKPGGEFYEVILRDHGAECSCPDFIFARENRDRKGCKHIAGLRAVGLLRREP
jgi:predicted nucleic acid-binding Zn finger protein